MVLARPKPQRVNFGIHSLALRPCKDREPVVGVSRGCYGWDSIPRLSGTRPSRDANHGSSATPGACSTRKSTDLGARCSARGRDEGGDRGAEAGGEQGDEAMADD